MFTAGKSFRAQHLGAESPPARLPANSAPLAAVPATVALQSVEVQIMKKLALYVLAFAGCANAAFAVDPEEEDFRIGFGNQITAFQTMYGVDGPFVGEKNPVRDVVGDELPWTVRFVLGDLDTRGHLRILVRGLVFKDDPSVPPELRGINDEAEFRGLVSCLVEGDGSVKTQNVVTEGFPANRAGNSYIHAIIQLPNPCVAPIVMVLAGSEDKWFAITGFESEEKKGGPARVGLGAR